MEKDVFLGHLPKNKHLKNLLQTAITESNQDFYPPLIPRIDIHNYVDKITKEAFLIAAWTGAKNAPEKILALYVGYSHKGFEYAFCPYVWVSSDCRACGIGKKLHALAVDYAKKDDKKGIRAKTWIKNNKNTLNFYKKLGYKFSAKYLEKNLNIYKIDLTLDFENPKKA